MSLIKTAQPVVAVIANRYANFQKPIVDQIASSLAASGYGLLCVVGRELAPDPQNVPEAFTACNAIYPAATHFDVRGYIVLSMSIGYHAAESNVIDLIQQYRHKPLVSLGVDIPLVASIVMDNERSMTELMEHMTTDPGRKRFVFIRGFRNMPDSIQREAVFRQVLARKGIEVDEDLILDGNFMSSETFAAVDELLSRTRDIDAVVAASDSMAASAIHALKKHGLRVPEDVLVSGFDDSAAATESFPPLTTIRQSFKARAAAAVDNVLTQIQHAANSQFVLWPVLPRVADGQLIARNSSVIPASNESENVALTTVFDASAFRQSFYESLTTLPQPAGVDLDKLIDDIVAMLVHGSADGEAHVRALLDELPLRPADITWWRNFHYQISVALTQFGDAGHSTRALPLMSVVLTLIHEAVWSVQAKSHFNQFKNQQILDRLHIQLTACIELQQLNFVLAATFERLGIRRAFLVLYESPHTIPGDLAELAFAYPAADYSVLELDPFPSTQILPLEFANELHEGMLVLSPLCTGNTHFGYLLIDPSSVNNLNIENLSHSISNSVWNCTQIRYLNSHTHALRSANSDLSYIANHDPLTGLSNRTKFQQDLQVAYDYACDNNSEFALLFLDLDGFKLVNDTHGHEAGDELLKIVAQRIRAVVRNNDKVSRLGGDEFTVILYLDGDTNDAYYSLPATVASKVLDTLGQPYALGNQTVSISASIGIARFPDDGDSAGTLVKHADAAMYHAKSIGKNCFSHYSRELDNDELERLQLDQDMRKGLSNGEFSLHFQPRVELHSNEFRAFEALLRWQPKAAVGNPDVLKPEVFIARAEQSGFITQLDTFALDQACCQAKQWEREGSPTKIAVNMSVLQLQQSSVVEIVQSTLSRYKLDPSMLEIEITETAAMTDIENNIDKLSALRSLGIEISLDDFGTGYSSLNYLKRLPVTRLKIDKSFLQDFNGPGSELSADAAIVRAVAALGKSMGYRLIAEGVESFEQRDFLLSLGFEEAQGFLYSRALTAAKATTYLHDNTAEHSILAALTT